MTLPANRAFIEYRHNAENAPGCTYRDCTAGWYYLAFHAFVGIEVYRAAEARRMVDEVYEDAGLHWPSTSPTSR